jgi:hypothetical protein
LKKLTRRENEKNWQTLVERSRHRAGSVEEFCNAEGVSLSAFGYWKKKLRSQSKLTKKTKDVSAFSRVEILEPAYYPPRSSALEAKWVAEIILHLHRGACL